MAVFCPSVPVKQSVHVPAVHKPECVIRVLGSGFVLSMCDATCELNKQYVPVSHAVRFKGLDLRYCRDGHFGS